MLYNVTTMASTWHTIATADTRLLKHQMDIVTRLPKDYVFLNYLRCHDDIGWGLDYEWLKQFGIAEAPHKKYLNDYFRGYVEGSDARGELYNDDPVLQDARLCGTTASLCGLEAAGFEQNEEKTAQAIQRIEMLNAYLFIQSGIPVIYSGDEIGQVNDYSYKESEDYDRRSDSRYIHRGHFRWDLEPEKDKKRNDTESDFCFDEEDGRAQIQISSVRWGGGCLDRGNVRYRTSLRLQKIRQ